MSAMGAEKHAGVTYLQTLSVIEIGHVPLFPFYSDEKLKLQEIKGFVHRVSERKTETIQIFKLLLI